MADGDVSLTQTASVLGTPAYMAPEQMPSARSADARSDVWALGVVPYELVKGCLPFTGDSFTDLVIATSMQPMPPPVRAPQLTPILERCLAKSPDERHAGDGRARGRVSSGSSHRRGAIWSATPACSARRQRHAASSARATSGDTALEVPRRRNDSASLKPIFGGAVTVHARRSGRDLLRRDPPRSTVH